MGAMEAAAMAVGSEAEDLVVGSVAAGWEAARPEACAARAVVRIR